MSLVAYDSDASDEERNDDEDRERNGLFDVLPQPARNPASSVEEVDDEFLHKKETPTERLPPERRKPVVFTVPSLSSFDEDEDEVVGPRFKKPPKGTGLLSMLPQPRQFIDFKKTPSTTLVPRVLTKTPADPTIKTPKKDTLKAKPPLITYGSSGDEDSSDGNVDFFSLSKKEEPLVEESAPNDVAHDVVENTIPVDPPGFDVPEAHYGPQPCYNYEASTIDSSAIEIDEEDAVRKLGSNRERRKKETMQFIEINQREILPDAREWLTKALTEDDNSDMVSTSKRKGEQPSGQQKRKHQITYLAHQAKANEKQLQKQWANNRQTRQQTQSKYGF